MRGLEGSTALVTGGSSGIGLATVKRLVEEGGEVVSFDLAPGPPDSPARLGLEGDVRDEGAIISAVERVHDELGGIDVVVNAAGVGGGGAVHLLEEEEWRRVVDVNLLGTFLVCKHALAAALERNDPLSIVNVASIEGVHGGGGASCYSAAKGGVVQLTRNIAIDYSGKKVRANAICPGFTETPLLTNIFDIEGMQGIKANILDATPMRRLCDPEEIASGIAFLASQDASFVNGQTLVVDGGLTAGFRIGITSLLGLA